MSASFWKGRTVLVTGHTGFKGAWLSLWLESLGADVVGYALDPLTAPNLFELARVGQGIRDLRGDVRDLERLTAVVRDHRPEVVFHLAAQSLVRPSYRDPVETYSTNVMGTVNLLEAIRRTGGTRAVVNVTSDKCYENHGQATGYREGDPMGGHDPYSSSKGCAELVTACYRRSYFSVAAGGPPVALASARAGNVIGGGDWATDRLIPDCMRSVMAGRPIPIRSPDAVRPWQFVLEPLGGYLLLAERLIESGPDFAEAWNFGPDPQDAKPVAWAADCIVDLWGGGTSWVRASGDPLHEAKELRLDCAKAKARLGWSPRTDLRRSLAWVVDWYKAYQAGRDLRDVTLGQVREFMSLERQPHDSA
jgi:CDP-glucose 4,6-dehydratase